MEVKKIYVDLQEAKKDGDVWRLESKAFKDPLVIQLEYSDHDKERINATKQGVAMQVAELHKVAGKIDEKEHERKELISNYKDQLKVRDNKIEELTKRLEKSGKEKVQLVKESNKIRETVEKQNEQLATLNKELAEIKQKLTKEPRVYSGQTFLSGNGQSGVTTIRVPDGNYIVSEVYKIVEKNEYVENEDMEIHAYNLHVTDGIFIPEYELRGTTGLDTPTATLEWTFTLLPY